MAPFHVTTAAASAEALGSVASIELVARNCRLRNYTKISKVPTVDVKGDFVAYASPDSTYAVTRQLMDNAKKDILIGIYDFSAGYMKDILLSAMQRGVSVSLMLDLDGVPGEEAIFNELKKFGCQSVPAPSCASENASYFASSHEKVIVIDGSWTLVQSGNYSKNSIPFNEIDGGDPDSFVTGNRDMGVAICSKPLAAFFTKVLRSDMKLELDAEVIAPQKAKKAAPDLVEAVPELIPPKLFPSKRFTPSDTVKVTPVLTPDNYMDVVPDFLESATKSIFIEQQYIRGRQAQVTDLLAAMKRAKDRNAGLDVRIILGKLFGSKDIQKEKENLAYIKKTFGLKLGDNIRFIDTKRFVHCHNKTIIVDDEKVLVSSQNWSTTAVSTNREAGLLFRYPAIARYFSSIFGSDWSTAARVLPRPRPATITPKALSLGQFLEVSPADYQEV